MTIVDAVRRTSSPGPLDDGEFGLLVKEHRSALLRHALRSTRDATSADDVVQETFIRAYRAYSRLQPGSRLGPWLHQILANVCIDEANRRHRETVKAERLSDQLSVSAPDFSPEHQLGLDADYSDLDAALASLSVEYREVLTKRFVDELSYHALAESVGVSEQNARARVSRARHAVITVMRGAAVLPLTTYFWLRKGRRASAAFERTQAAALTPGTSGVSTAMSANRLATSLAPAIDAANTLVTAAPAAAPLLARVAVGVGIVAAASISIGHDSTTVSSQTSSVIQFDSDRQRPVMFGDAPGAGLAIGAAVTTSIPTSGSGATTAAPVADRPAPAVGAAISPAADAGAALPVSPTGLIADPSSAAVSAAVPAIDEVVATTITNSVPVTAPSKTPVPATPKAPASTIAGGTPTTVVVDTSLIVINPVAVATTVVVDTSVPSSTVVPPDGVGSIETAPATTLAPAVLIGGTLTVSSVTATPAGPRTDLSGAVTLTIGGDSLSGSMSGRISVDLLAAPGTDQRLDGTLTLSLSNHSAITVRLAGFAATTADGSASFRGQFRASGDTATLALAGSFSGTLATQLLLTLSP